MSDQVLVAFATTEEPTSGIASAVADALRGAGVPVVLEPLDAVHQVRPYRAAILGTAIHDGTWLPGFDVFLAGHELDLSRMPVWLFASGAVDRLPGHELEEPSAGLIARIERIGPRDLALFAGSLQPHHLVAGLRALRRITRTTISDHRDWAAIRRWSDGIGEALAREPIDERRRSSSILAG